MAEKPDASTPKQTETWSDCKAVYRLFARPKVTFEAVMQTYDKKTRAMPPERYLVISGATEVDPPLELLLTSYDLTASGLHRDWDNVEPNRNRVGEACSDFHFGMLDINWSGNHSITFRIHDMTDRARVRKSVKLSELKL